LSDESLGAKQDIKPYGGTDCHMNTELRQTPAVLLLSGGLDSAACLSLLTECGFPTKCLFIDYGQPSASRERDAAQQIARYYAAPINILRCSGFGDWPDSALPGRNAFFVTSAVMAQRQEKGFIVLGLQESCGYPDTGSRFVRSMQSILDLYTDGRVRLFAPFADWTKQDIWEYCHLTSVPVHLTYSCDLGLEQPCGRCNSCRDVESLWNV